MSFSELLYYARERYFYDNYAKGEMDANAIKKAVEDLNELIGKNIDAQIPATNTNQSVKTVGLPKRQNA